MRITRASGSGGSGAYPLVFACATADATGATDASAAIQAKIDAAAAAGGGIVSIPAGSFRLDASLVPANKVSIIGAGRGKTVLLPYGLVAAVKKQGANVAASLTDAHFADFTIDGTNQAGTYATSIKGFYIQYLLRCSFTRLRVYNTGATGVGNDFHVDCTYDDVIAENCGRLNDGTQGGGAGIGIGTGQSTNEPVTFRGCVTRSNKRDGLFFETQTGGMSLGATVIGHFSDSNGQHGIADAGCSGLSVVGGHSINNVKSGFAAYGGTISPGAPGLAGVIVGLECKSNTENGVLIDATVRESSNIRYTIRGCKIRQNTLHGVYVSAGASTDVQGVVIADNEIYSNQRAGVLLTSAGATVTDLTIENNRIFTNGLNTGASERQGIRIGASTTRINVRGNRCWDTQGSPTQTYGIQFNGGTTVTNGDISNNDVRGNLTGGVQPSATFTTCVVGDNPGWNTGITGTPEGAVIAPIGTIARRSDGGASTTLYVKESGTGNTGWIAK